MMGLKVKFPINDAGRELIYEAVQVLVEKRHEMERFGIHSSIAELLSYLPEVQLLGTKNQEVCISGTHYTFVRRIITRPLLDAVSRASRFENHYACELTCLMVKYRRALGN